MKINDFLPRFTVPVMKGILLTLALALAARLIAGLPFFSIMGQLVIAIMFGMLWRAFVGVNSGLMEGASFSSKKLLRLGIILLGFRLNLSDIYNAGATVFMIAFANLVFALLTVYGLSRLFKVEKRLGILTACGTAICGAAAVVAIAPVIKANEKETAVGAANVAVLGTIFTIVYTLLFSYLGLNALDYGVFTGGTLHEIAHVVAAADPAGQQASDLAIIVKLTRVALLVPVAILIGFIIRRKETQSAGQKMTLAALPIPWFILGFLAVSALNTTGVISEDAAAVIVSFAYLLIGMAMAGLGLSVDFKSFRQMGGKALSAGLAGSVLLSLFGYFLVKVFL
ncbi:putative sulfate exporter family transporter [Bacillus sp. JJ1609]|uniref:YeiH family protein n=1 Tax=Bacillus sp. JJ1609 TaxID=3122977 RepID=UPI002FFE6C41